MRGAMRTVHLFEDLLGYRLRRADVLVMARLKEALAPLGLTPARVTALAYIHRDDGCDQTALGRALGVNRASAMALVDQLAARGLVERRPGADRRSNALGLTPAGEATRSAMVRVLHETEDAVFAPLDPAERTELGRLLNKIRRSLTAPGEPVTFVMSNDND